MSALLTAPQVLNLRRQSKYGGLNQFLFTPQGTELELECWMEYSPAEAQTWDKPGCDEQATLCYAEVSCTDILEILNEVTIQEIEAAFLAQEMEAA